jgi:hypothetical protein
MIKKFKFFNGSMRATLGSALVIGLFFFVSCDSGSGDPAPELYPLTGVYTFDEAILQTELVLPLVAIPGNPVTIAEGTDITDQMQEGLLAEAPCDNSENGSVELKENKELFFACIGETNEDKAGTWSINSDTTELTLILSVEIGTLQLKIEDFEIDAEQDIIGGTISSFPITKALLPGFLAGYNLSEQQIQGILAGVDDNWTALVDVDIKFKKES